MSHTSDSVLAIALELAAMGLPTFPCTQTKVPAISRANGGHGFHDAVTDPDEVRALFARAPDAKLVGVPTGPRTFDVLDVDPAKGGAAWEEDHIDELPETLIRATPRGGRHYHFIADSAVRNSEGQIAPGIDVRGTGGYVCFGNGYSIIHAAELAPWPDWLLGQVRAKPAPPPRPDTDSNPDEAITDQRLRGLLAALLANISAAQDGEKHRTLLRIAHTIGGYAHLFEIDDGLLVELMLNALPDTVRDWNNARRTAFGGLRMGRLRPLDLEDRFAFIDPAEPHVPGSDGPAPITRDQAKSIARATYTLLRQHRPRDEAWAELQRFTASIGVGPEAARRIALTCINQHRGGTA